MATWLEKLKTLESYIDYTETDMTELPPVDKRDTWKPPTMGLADLFTFGKKKGKQLEDVIEDDPNYLEWCIEKNVVKFDEKALETMAAKGIG